MININKKKLYLDFDGVICNTIKTIVKLYSEDFKYYKKFEPIDWSEVETWDFTELEAAKPEYIDTYFNQQRFFDNVEWMPWAKDIIEKLSEIYDIKVCSAGYYPNLVGKVNWLEKNMPYAEFIGVNFKNYSDKSHVDMSDGIFIDDSAKNLITSNAETKICFGDVYEWNKDWDGIRCANWHDVWELIGEDNKEE